MMNCETGFCIASASDGACLSFEDPRGARHWGRIFVPQTSHEGGTVKRLFFGFSQFFVRSGKGRSSSRRLRSGSRSARKGSRDRNASELGGVPPERRLCFAAP